MKNYKKVKRTTFDFDRIAHFFINKDSSDAHQLISNRTLQDLDFEELFMFIDRTCSKIGQQYLYATLRTIPKNMAQTRQFEKIMNYLNERQNIKESIIVEVNRLNKTTAYYLQSLIYKKNISRPKWFWIIPLFSGLSVASLFLSFIFPLFALVLIVILAINTILHQWNKKNILFYSNAIPQLIILHQVTDKMLRSGVFLENTEQVQKSNHGINKISRLAIFFKLEPMLTSEMGLLAEYLLDLFKAAFLLEPILLFKIIKEIELKKAEISNIFNAVAQVDAAISVSSIRETLPYYTLPDITEDKKSLSAEEIYHPLIIDPVANTIELCDGKSVLLTGSNMSG